MLGVVACTIAWMGMTHPAHAAVSDWQKGANMVPKSTSDFGSDTFKKALTDLKDTGATYVTFVIPYYQQSRYDPTMGPGWNTPTDDSLQNAISQAHTLGFKVMLKPHLESYDLAWRANIETADRNKWYGAYSSMLNHYGQLAQATGVEQICIGTELIGMASSYVNSDNTTRWQSLIHDLRGLYSGKLTYNANSDTASPWNNEKEYIGFWQDLDMVGISVYYNLGNDDSVQALMSSWDAIRKNDIEPFARRVGKPLLFTEVGYRSVDGTTIKPWDYYYTAPVDEIEQANAYEALMSYWNNYSYLQGIHIWEWETTSYAGGPGTSSYTPQHKKAEEVLKRWFSNAATPQTTPPDTTPPSSTFTIKATGPQNIPTGQSSTFTINVQNHGQNLTGLNIDIEIYGNQNQRAYQQIFTNEGLAIGQTKSYTVTWTPATKGSFSIQVGIFNSTWATTYYWLNNALAVQVDAPNSLPPSNTPPTNPPPSNSIDIWWPTHGSHISGLQPFQAMMKDTDVQAYSMYWQVDGDRLNDMHTSTQDYPHKEAMVDVTNWHWNSTGVYHIAFIAKGQNGGILATQGVDVTINS